MIGFDSRALVVDCGSKKVDDLVAIVEAEGWAVTRLKFDEMMDYDLIGVDAAIISGGPHLFTDPDPDVANSLRKEFQWLPRLNMPVLGICLGHQVLALAAGADIFRGPERRKTDAIEIKARHPLLNGIDSDIDFAEDHCEGAPLPAGYVLLASSKHYDVEAMANDSLARYGVQFHPEISDEPGRRLIMNFLRIADERQRLATKRPKPIFAALTLLCFLAFVFGIVGERFSWFADALGWGISACIFGVAFAMVSLAEREPGRALVLALLGTFVLSLLGLCWGVSWQ